jgi:glucose-6-phosphate isomerase
MKRPIRDVRIVNPERLEPDLARGVRGLEDAAVVRRIWERDWTVWKPVDREISNRLGWLEAPAAAEDDIPGFEAFAASIRDLGLTRAVVLGMGGSSLAPEVYARLFDARPGFLDLEVLDTTAPETVAAAADRFPVGDTLFIVSSKSGTTAEMLALFSFFYDRARMAFGPGRAGDRFVAITDPGTPLETLARKHRFRHVFSAAPDIGGRFSALSAFGLVPAALRGIDLRRLLAPARAMADACRLEGVRENPGALLGAVLGTAANKGLDKLTLLLPQRLRPLAGWLEQLMAESTGKEGRGIVPIVEDRPGPPGSYGGDRLFVEIGPAGTAGPKKGVRAPGGAGSPLVRLALDGPYDLAGHFFLWEFATAVAAHVMKINAFDQPDVESAKKRTLEVLAAAAGAGGAAPEGQERPPFAGGLRIFPKGPSESPQAVLTRFLSGRREGDYIALLAFLPRSGAVEEALSGLAAGLRIRTGLPVTVGFGPRYLHSTGQLHKGDGNRGLFVMLVEADLPELAIPEVPGVVRPAPDFGALFRAQARGDALALAGKGRRILTLELSSPVQTGLASLSSFLE